MSVLAEKPNTSSPIEQASTKAPLAFFLPDLRGAGAERVMLNLSCAFADMGRTVHLVLVTARGAYLDRVPDNVKVVDLRGRQTILALPALVSYLRRERPSVLLSALEHTSVVSLWARRLAGVATRIVVCVHNNLSTDYLIAKSVRKRVELQMVRLFYRFADSIIAVSHGVAADAAELIGLPRDRVEVIYNPVVSDKLLEMAREPVDHPWFAAGEPPVILSVGRLTAQKDQEMLLRAFAKMRASMRARLMILGEGEERVALESLARAMEIDADVLMPGFVQNPFAYMSSATVFALSSKYEGLPTVLIEALASGTRVVSTNCPSGPEEILANGKYGKLVPVGDADAMAAALIEACSASAVKPDDESWRPYLNQTAVENYRRALRLG
jgi:glycosyltransferase involved in cell wall biosynthesis